MMEVICNIETHDDDKQIIKLHSDFLNDEMVTIEASGKYYTVLASDLKKAIENCTNTNILIREGQGMMGYPIIYEVISRLNGDIEAIGDALKDIERNSNLANLCMLLNLMLEEVIEITGKNDQRSSVRENIMIADSWLETFKRTLDDFYLDKEGN